MPDPQHDYLSKMQRLIWLVPVVGLTMLAIVALGYRYDRSAYFQVLKAVMGDTYPSPFIDAQQIPAVIDCLSTEWMSMFRRHVTRSIASFPILHSGSGRRFCLRTWDGHTGWV
jgi:hypothetical protein